MSGAGPVLGADSLTVAVHGVSGVPMWGVSPARGVPLCQGCPYVVGVPCRELLLCRGCPYVRGVRGLRRCPCFKGRPCGQWCPCVGAVRGSRPDVVRRLTMPRPRALRRHFWPCHVVPCRAAPLHAVTAASPRSRLPTPPAAACGGGAVGRCGGEAVGRWGGGAVGPLSCRFEAPRCHLRDANPALPAAYGALPEPRRRGRRCCGCSALRHPRRLRAGGATRASAGRNPKRTKGGVGGADGAGTERGRRGSPALWCLPDSDCHRAEARLPPPAPPPSFRRAL